MAWRSPAGSAGSSVELVPDRAVRVADASAATTASSSPRGGPGGGDVGEPVAHVLDEDLEVVGALPVGQGRVDLARLGVDEERLDPIAVTPEQGVGERAVAPEHAAAMQVDEQPGHGVEQAVR